MPSLTEPYDSPATAVKKSLALSFAIMCAAAAAILGYHVVTGK
jgi:hypothetical protein